jgi:type I restriction enzyme S subunit
MKKDWTYKRFDEVFDLQMGKTPSRDNPSYWGGDNVWVSIADIQNKYIDSSKESITDEAVSESGIKEVPKDTVIMSFKLSVGRSAITTRSLYTNEAIMAFNTKSGFNIMPAFIYYYLQGYKWEGANKAVMGMTLNKKSISSNTFAFPVFEEQQQIVAELDLLSDVIEKQKAQIEELDKLSQSIFYDMFGDPVTNDKGWVVSKYGEKFKISSGGTPSKTNPEYWDNGNIPWIGSNMCQNCVIYDNDGKYITEKGLNSSSTNILKVGTVLIALVGATIGKVALLQKEMATNQNIANINVWDSKEFNSMFIFFHSMNLYHLFMNLGDGGFKMANQGFIRELPLICPPLSLQQEFAAKIEAIEVMKAKVRQSLIESETLFNSRMDYYFN